MHTMEATRTVEDAVGRRVRVPIHPKRIVSLCPSQTETLAELAPDRLVGRTKFCVHRKDALERVPEIGGTKQVRRPDLDALQPDLIIGEKEEQTPELVEELAQDYPVYLTDVVDIASALTSIHALGELIGEPQQAKALVTRIQAAWEHVPRLAKPQTVWYLIWQNPFMGVGANTFIDSVLQKLGLANALVSGQPAPALSGSERYPSLDLNAYTGPGPDLILLSSEPYPFTAERASRLKKRFPTSRIECVNGEWFSWYGSRMLVAADGLAQWLRGLAG